MRAAVIDPSEGTLTIQERTDPVAGPGQLLVQVRAAGLNRADLLARTGRYVVGTVASAPRPFVGGGELAGEVLAVGEGVDGFTVGDRVMSQGAGYAELAVIDARFAMPMPASLTWEQAGALPVALLTMHDAIVTNGRWVPGDAVSMHAVTSGVGVVGAQIAMYLGSPLVIGTSRSADKRTAVAALLHDDRFVACDPADYVETARRLTDNRGVEICIDNVGATAISASIDAAAILGRIVQVGRLGGRMGTFDLDELARKRISLIGVTFRTRSLDERIAVRDAAWRDLAAAVASGAVSPVVHEVFTLENADAAQQAMKHDQHIGKLVLVP